MKPEYEIHPKESRNFTIKRKNTKGSIDYIKTRTRLQTNNFKNIEFQYVFNEDHGTHMKFIYQKSKLSLVDFEGMNGV